MRVLLLTSSQNNQVALANKIAARWELVGIAVEKKPTKKKNRQLLKKVVDVLLYYKIRLAWKQLMEHYKQNFENFPKTELLQTSDINDVAVKDFIIKMKPDALLVSGTSLIKKPILEIVLPLGMLNLHTGLSPYIKGGPNCTNWCISTGQFHLIGNTIMWIDAGIDSGDLLLTDTVAFTGNENLFEIHLKVMDAAHALYLAAIEQLAYGKAKRVAQKTIATGKVYYTRDWGETEKRDLLIQLKKFKRTVGTKQYLQALQNITLVK